MVFVWKTFFTLGFLVCQFFATCHVVAFFLISLSHSIVFPQILLCRLVTYLRISTWSQPIKVDVYEISMAQDHVGSIFSSRLTDNATASGTSSQNQSTAVSFEQFSVQDGEVEQSTLINSWDASTSTSTLYPADSGKNAWLFLAGSFIIEALVWGMSITR